VIMQQGLYVALSSQLALQRRLDTLAHNVANASTAGFRSEEIRFETLLSEAASGPVAFADTGKTYLAVRAGPLSKTGNPLDVAIKGHAWLAIQTPSGQALTRDGRMRMSANGQLESVEGYPFLDAGGSPIQLNAAAGPPAISADGTIRQGTRQIGALGLFRIDPDARLSRGEGTSIHTSRPAVPVLDFTDVGVVQGHAEGSNVNPVLEMSRLIAVTRAFDLVSAGIGMAETSQQEAIRILGDAR